MSQKNINVNLNVKQSGPTRSVPEYIGYRERKAKYDAMESKDQLEHDYQEKKSNKKNITERFL